MNVLEFAASAERVPRITNWGKKKLFHKIIARNRYHPASMFDELKI